MSAHYTPKFKAAYARVLKVVEEHGEEQGKVAFRDEMLALGHEERIRNLYRIVDKLSSKPAFFVPNEPQLKYLENKTKRDIILKIRQVGFTTLSSIRGLDYALWEKNHRCGILAHKQNTVTTIFQDLVKFSYSWFKRDWGHLYAPEEKASSHTELAFKSDGLGRILDSSMRVMFDFRGKTINFLHVSEASRVDDNRLLGSLQGVPANGEVILESTPSGQAGNFYDRWQEFEADPVSAVYKGHFIPWYTFYPEVPEDFQPPENYAEWTYLEREIKDRFDLEDYHLVWRRWCIKANCNGDPEQFENEYPSNTIDCFLTGESQVFGSTITKQQMTYNREPAFNGLLFSQGKVIKFEEEAKGYLSIWEKPKPTGEYVVGADPASGVGKDKSAAYVKDRNSKKIVARIWGHLSPVDFAGELYKLVRYYNKAWLCVEENNHGHVVIQKLKEYQYPNLYKEMVIDEYSNKPTKKLGFRTTNQSKLKITEFFKASCKSRSVIITDKELIREMTQFVQVASKNAITVKRQALPGQHDDLVIAACLTEEMDRVRGDYSSASETQPEFEEGPVDPFTGFAS